MVKKAWSITQWLLCAKQDIATFFHALHELGIIKTDTDDLFNSQTKLKNYIDAANIFYSDKFLEIIHFEVFHHLK